MTSNLRVGDLVVRNAARMPDAVAVIDPGGTLSWRQLDRGANRLASGLLAAGLSRGDRVATVIHNSAAAVEMLFALAKAGLIGVPINYGLTLSEVRQLLADSDPRCVVVDAEYATGEFVDTVAAALPAKPPTMVLRNGEVVPDGWLDYDDVRLRGRDDFDSAGVSADDIRTIRYTSGTTAVPKGCMGTHRQILASIANYFLQVPAPDSGPFLQLLPLFSGAGIWMSFAAAYQGVATVIQPSFDAAEALRSIEATGAAHTLAVPTMVSRLTEEFAGGGYRIDSFKLLGYTGAPMPPKVIRRAMEILPCEFYQGFGGGEIGGLVSFLLPEDHAAALADERMAERLRSAGRPARYAEVRIRAIDGTVLGRTEVGEITVRSPSNFSGYWNRPEETAHTVRGDWVYTGDMGYFDEAGYLYAVDRAKDMVITGGNNVSPAEVEAVLMEHPDIAAASVIGLPDEEWGEAVTAVVVARTGASPGQEEILRHARAHLAGYKTPKSVKFVDALPLNSAGKVLKRALRERFASPAETA
ncbi:class I adenylate-forming enzyme family protein [Rugosimonospora africana]|uniref:Fatty-acid--CoA ligase n=1 Tax=Rugosimonospora africana TaxID=556532 RepID=A0A8J3QQN8_9ACTN|nr:AMP-binding protein [Rugosimonospora africana]GIH13910.1 fatty-acid--CoA ligase [Rugosimonospora africana]